MNEQNFLSIIEEGLGRPKVPELAFKEFIPSAWRIIEPATPFIHNWHIDALSDHLEAVTRRDIKKLLITIPPRKGKSRIASIFWTAWVWTKYPGEQFLCSSYSADLSTEHNIYTRRIIQSDWYQKNWGKLFTITSDQNRKCITAGSPVLMASGNWVPIEKVKAGDIIISASLPSGKLVKDRVLHSWSEGVHTVKKITLSDGTIITATPNHRFYGWGDWIYVEDMKVGDAVAVIKQSPEVSNSVTKDEAFLAALWLAEGTKKHSAFFFSTVDQKVINRVEDIASKRGWSLSKRQDCSYILSKKYNRNGDTPRNFLRKFVDIDSCSVDSIRIPAKIFEASREVILEFIGTYLACDGCVINSKNHGLSIFSASERLIRDFNLLLKRLGISSSVRSRKINYRYKGKLLEGKDCWQLNIKYANNVLLLKELYLYEKQDKFEGLLKFYENRNRTLELSSIPPLFVGQTKERGMWRTRSVADRLADAYDLEDVKLKLSSDLDWRRVVSIEDAGSQEVFHIQTEETSLFFVEGILSHNTYFQNDHSGYRMATSVGGVGTGFGGSVILVDDPHNIKEAPSKAKREAVIKWWTQVMSTRLNNPKTGVMVVIQQRCHINDLAGFLIEQGDWEHLNFPEEYEPTRAIVTSMGWKDPREVRGELLWPQTYGRDELTTIKKTLGTYGFSCQYQQNPIPIAGGIINRQWWRYWDEQDLPKDATGRVRFDSITQSWDLAFKSTEASDYVVGQVWGSKGADRFLLDQVRDKLSFTETLDAITAFANKWNTNAIYIEDKANGPAVISILKRELIGVIPVDPQGDKVSRVMAVSPQIEAGNVFLPRKAPWLEDFIEEFASATAEGGGEYWDQIDATSQALLKLSKTVRKLTWGRDGDTKKDNSVVKVDSRRRIISIGDRYRRGR